MKKQKIATQHHLSSFEGNHEVENLIRITQLVSRWGFKSALYLIAITILSTPLYASYRNIKLPTPSGLRTSVHFWESIFNKHSPEHCVVHDNLKAEIVYGVWKVGSKRSRNRRIKQVTARVRTAIERFGRGKSPRNRFEKKIYKSVPRRNRSSRFFRSAKNRIRCQRGVNLHASMNRSQSYLPMIRKIFQKLGLPKDLSYLPHIESSFNSRARSKAGAVGMWQIMAGTARGKLRMHRRYDSRRNPKKATLFAGKHLKKLYRKTQSWPLAVTAYNYGINGTRRAIRKYGRNYMKIRQNHRTSIFRFAAKNYYPSFLAVRNIADKDSLNRRKMVEIKKKKLRELKKREKTRRKYKRYRVSKVSKVSKVKRRHNKIASKKPNPKRLLY